MITGLDLNFRFLDQISEESSFQTPQMTKRAEIQPSRATPSVACSGSKVRQATISFESFP
jgi:hypothetical protein